MSVWVRGVGTLFIGDHSEDNEMFENVRVTCHTPCKF
jgi:hypothetical protein